MNVTKRLGTTKRRASRRAVARSCSRMRAAACAAAASALLGLAPAWAFAQAAGSPGAPDPDGCGSFIGIDESLAAMERAHDSASGGEGAALTGSGALPFGDLFVIEDDGSLTFFGVTDSIR